MDEQQYLIKSPERKQKKNVETVWRRGEMDPEHALFINIRKDTDIDIGIAKIGSEGRFPFIYKIAGVDDYNRDDAVVTFCCCSAGGGKSSRTRKALFELICAIELDNLSDKKEGNGYRGGMFV